MYCKASSKSGKEECKRPRWRNEYNFGKKYQPSYNIAPSEVTPVLVSAAHFGKNRSINDRVIVPMVWGMIPYWHSRSVDHRKHGYRTINCRAETILQSRLYKRAFSSGKRCVVLCEGFYAWQTTNPNASKRPAFYVYPSQHTGIKIENSESVDKPLGKLNLLKMAGLFDVWENADGEQMYSYAVITLEADDQLNWLNDRMPAILESEKDVADWIDYKRVTDSEYLLSLLRPAEKLQWHQVSNVVNNARNKTDLCNKPINLENTVIPRKRKLAERGMDSKKLKLENGNDEMN